MECDDGFAEDSNRVRYCLPSWHAVRLQSSRGAGSTAAAVRSPRDRFPVFLRRTDRPRRRPAMPPAPSACLPSEPRRACRSTASFSSPSPRGRGLASRVVSCPFTSPGATPTDESSGVGRADPVRRTESRPAISSNASRHEGVELLRSELLSTGLFDRDGYYLSEQGLSWGEIEVHNGDRLVTVDWCCPALIPAMRPWPGRNCPRLPRQTRALIRLSEGSRTSPRGCRPAPGRMQSQWHMYRARYAICYRKGYEPGLPIGLLGTDQSLAPSRVLGELPAPAQDLLTGKDSGDPPSRQERRPGRSRGVLRGHDRRGACARRDLDQLPDSSEIHTPP